MKKIIFILILTILPYSLFSQTIRGIDVSHWQGTINWQDVYNDNIVFSYAKATEGMTVTDSKFISNMNNGTNAGVIMGAYHFARPENNTALEDATNFLNTASAYIGNGYLPPALDIESIGTLTFSQLSIWVQEWLTIVENQTGVVPILYMNAYYANNLSSSLNSYDLWIANFETSQNTPPADIGNWNDWVIKQYSEIGSVSGISGNVDLDVFNGSVNDFNNFIIGGGSGSNLDCSNAVSLNCGVIYHGSSSTANSNVNSYGCNNWTETGPERVHTITPSSNGVLTATISNFTGDLDVFILGSCDPSDCLGTVSSSSATYSNAQSGYTYYIVVDADDGSGSSYDIIVDCPSGSGLPDIIVQNENVSPTTVQAGNTISVSCRIRNSSSYDANDSGRVGYYLSTNTTFDNSDDLLDYSPFGTLDANEYSDENDSFTIPSNTSAGTYYILFFADYQEDIEESDENNNLEYQQITVTNNGLPDIIVQNENASPTTIQAGNTMSVSCRIRNNSSYDATDSGRVGYYLSTNTTFDNSDDLLDYSPFGTLDANEYSDKNDSFTIPSNTSAGTYYILFFADYQENIEEGDESNNVEYQQITVANSSNLTYVPDNNFEQALIDLGYDDTLDDYVLTSNISSLTNLDIGNKNISDLTGIEDFLALEIFECYDNQISNIDISHNINLISLGCNNNQITSLNTSSNPNLLTLGCRNNLLSSIDLSQNNLLENLYLDYNQITILDLTSNLNLIWLQCHNNNLTSVTFSQSDSLESVRLYNNELTNINLNSHINLVEINCRNNQITELDLSSNNNLSWVYCYDNNLNLLNVKNGNNGLLTVLEANNNNNLNCIQVDDEISANNGTGVYANWVVDSNVSYSENCTLGIGDEYLIQNISIFPNPTTDKVYIDNPINVKIYQIIITNSLGQKIKNVELINSSIDLTNYSSGIYFIKLFDENGRKITFKVIKK